MRGGKRRAFLRAGGPFEVVCHQWTARKPLSGSPGGPCPGLGDLPCVFAPAPCPHQPWGGGGPGAPGLQKVTQDGKTTNVTSFLLPPHSALPLFWSPCLSPCRSPPLPPFVSFSVLSHCLVTSSSLFLSLPCSPSVPCAPCPSPFSSPGSPLPHVGAALTVTTHPHISIKSEPVSPSRERSPAPPPPAVFPATRPEPGDGLSSPAGGSYETGDRDDGRGDFGPTLGLLRPAPEPEAEGSAVKRMRLDTWVL